MTVRRLTNNLAAEPFLNRRVPVAVALALAGLAVAATAANLLLFVVRGGEYRQYRAERAAQQERMAQLAQELKDQARVLEGREVSDYVAGARFAQALLEEKRFSWNRFLEDLEDAKPFGVMYSDIAPRGTSDGTLEVRLRGAANSREEVLALEQNLLESPAFRSPQLDSEEKDQGGTLTRFSITVRYAGPSAGAP